MTEHINITRNSIRVPVENLEDELKLRLFLEKTKHMSLEKLEKIFEDIKEET